MREALSTCALCPRLCRHACPVASMTGREAAVPAQLAGVLWGWSAGRVSDDVALQAATLCVDCGACQDACHLHRPLPELLQQARQQLAPSPPCPEGPVVQGAGRLVAVETDARRWADALAARTGEPAARLEGGEALAGVVPGAPGWDRYLAKVRQAFGERVAVVAHGGAHRVMVQAGVQVVWLDERVEGLGPLRASCAPGRGGCCGGAGPLAEHHPEDARLMAVRWGQGRDTPARDARCGAHLRAVGVPCLDAIDRLLEVL